LSVTVALSGIAGSYTVVMGFDEGGLSYYPDLPPEFNTLHVMEPQHGYWIRTTEPVTLVYSTTVGLATAGVGESRSDSTEDGLPLASLPVYAQPLLLREMLRQNGVTASTTWMSFYGPAKLADGSPLPQGATVQAVDPDGVVCGAAVVANEGQYGLLACYGDDLDTALDEGAEIGDVIRLLVDGQVLGSTTWTAFGECRWVPLGEVELRRLYLPFMGQGVDWTSRVLETTPEASDSYQMYFPISENGHGTSEPSSPESAPSFARGPHRVYLPSLMD